MKLFLGFTILCLSFFAMCNDCIVTDIRKLDDKRKIELKAMVNGAAAIEECKQRMGGESIAILGGIKNIDYGWSYYRRTYVLADGSLGKDLIVEFIFGSLKKYDVKGIRVHGKSSEFETAALFQKSIPRLIECLSERSCKRKILESYGFFKRYFWENRRKFKIFESDFLRENVRVDHVVFADEILYGQCEGCYEVGVLVGEKRWRLFIKNISGEYHLENYGKVSEY